MSVSFGEDAYALLSAHLGSMVLFYSYSAVAKADRFVIGLRYVETNVDTAVNFKLPAIEIS